MRHREVETPIGPLWLYASPRGLAYVGFGAQDCPAWLETCQWDPRAANTAASQITEYFTGARTHFDLAVDVPGESFTHRAQHALAQIPYGQTLSYSELAHAAGNARAVRAAASACARNPLPIVWPCHRVIRADGSLGKYRGGEAAKRWLVDWEGTRVTQR